MLAVFQPVGIFIAAIFSLYAANAGGVDFSSAHRSLVLAAGAAVAIWLGALRLLGDARKAALVTSLVALLFWSSSSIVSAIEKIAYSTGISISERMGTDEQIDPPPWSRSGIARFA